MLVELNRTKPVNFQNQIMANFEQLSQECGNFSLRILLLQQLETYDSGSGWNIDTPAGVDSGTPVCVHLCPTHENDRSASTVVAGSVMIMRFYWSDTVLWRKVWI